MSTSSLSGQRGQAYGGAAVDANYDLEDRTTPLLALRRVQIRLAQLCMVMIACGVTYSATSEYLRRFDDGVIDLAAQREVAVSTGRKNFFLFAVTLALAASMFSFCAILAVRYSHRSKTPKQRLLVELGSDAVAILCLVLGATLLLNPAAVGGNPADLTANSDLRNVACVLAANEDFSGLAGGTYIDYPAICRKLWCGIVFAYFTLFAFVASLFLGIDRARRVFG